MIEIGNQLPTNIGDCILKCMIGQCYVRCMHATTPNKIPGGRHMVECEVKEVDLD